MDNVSYSFLEKLLAQKKDTAELEKVKELQTTITNLSERYESKIMLIEMLGQLDNTVRIKRSVKGMFTELKLDHNDAFNHEAFKRKILSYTFQELKEALCALIETDSAESKRLQNTEIFFSGEDLRNAA